MKPKCRTLLDSVRVQAGGKPLTDAQAAAIESRIRGTAKFLAQTDKDWSTYSADQRTLLAAQQAAADIKADAAERVRRAELQVLKKAETDERLKLLMDSVGFNRARAAARDYQQTDDQVRGLVGEYTAKMNDAVKAASSTKGVDAWRWVLMKAFEAQNPGMTRDMAVEIHANGKGGTGNADAIAAAKAWNENVTEPMRQRFNAAGGSVGKLDYGYMPTMWEPELVLKAGRDKFAQDMLPHLDRKRYVKEDGAPMNDAEVIDLLRAAGETIGTDGANKADASAFQGGGSRANKGSEHRQIHFKDGEAYVAAMAKYGSGSMYDAMTGHVAMLARDIALVERYGPNPEATHRVIKAEVMKDDKAGMPSLVAWSDLDHHWREVAGKGVARWRVEVPTELGGNIVGDFTGAGTARFFGHVRNVETFGKLQGAVISSLTDTPTTFAAAHMNKLPMLDLIANIPRAFASNTPGLRALQKQNVTELMETIGMASDSVVRSMNRFTGENASSSWSGHVSSATFRLSLMNWWTESMRNAYSLTMQKAFAKNLKKNWADLDEYTRVGILGLNGITEKHWQVLQKAQPLKTAWGDITSPDAVYATGHPDAAETVSAYLGFLHNRQESAVLNPDVAARAFWRRSSEAGSAGGEISRSISQFQMFPTSMFTRFYRGILEVPSGLEGAPAGFGDMPYNRLAFIGSTMAAMTFFGAIAFQAKQVVAGKDPVDMTGDHGVKFWARAFAQGGGLPFLADVMLNDPDQYSGRGFEKSFGILGPTAGSIGQVLDLTQGNLAQAAAGKDTHAGAETIRALRSHAPLVNLWYAKTAIDQAALHAMQEAASPGYLARVRQRAQKDWGTDWWAPPGGGVQRAPDLGKAVGQ